MAHATMAIYDLGCGEARTIERVLTQTPGVVRAYVNPATEMAYVEYDADAVAPRDLETAMRRAGFRAGAAAVR